MRKLTVGTQIVPLLPDAAITFDLSSNLVDLLSEANTAGSFTMPFTVPDTPQARLAFGDLQRLDNRAKQPVSYAATYEEAGFFLKGNFELRSYKPGKGFRGNLITSEKSVVAKLKAARLREMDLGGIFNLGNTESEVRAHMKDKALQPRVQHYTFAPVHNPSYYKNNEEYGLYQAQYLNRWMPETTSSGAYGSGGSFPENTLAEPNGPGHGTYFPIVPQPSLYYVLRQGFAELGMSVEDNFFDDELKNLVLLCNTSLDAVEFVLWKPGAGYEYDWLGGGTATYEPGLYRFKNTFRKSFRIAELLPDISFHELLRKLQATFGLVLTVSLSGNVRFSKVEQALSRPERKPLDRYFLKGPELEFPAKTGLLLKYRTQNGDSIAGEETKSIEGYTYKGEVYDLPELNSIVGKKVKDCYYVLTEKAYYAQEPAEAEGFWFILDETKRVAGSYQPHKIGDGAASFTQGIAATVDQSRPWLTFTEQPAVPGWPAMEALTAEMGEVRFNQAVNEYYVYTRSWEANSEGESIKDWLLFCQNTDAAKEAMFNKWKVPALQVQGYNPVAGQQENSTELRLAFFRGLQPFAQGTQLYPMLSGDNLNVKGEPVGEYSLRWEGENGLGEKFLKSWVRMMNGRLLRGTLAWDQPALTELDLDELFTLEGQRAVIKNIKFTLPMRKPAQVELMIF